MESELGFKGDDGDLCSPDGKKGQKHCLLKEKHRVKGKNCFNEKFRFKDVNTLLNVVLCLLCGISVSFSGYFSYREIRLESRIIQLELELAQKFSRIDSILPRRNEIVVERLRRDLQQRNFNRELSNVPRLMMKDEEALRDDILNSEERRRRETPDCVCRPGMSSHFSPPPPNELREMLKNFFKKKLKFKN